MTWFGHEILGVEVLIIELVFEVTGPGTAYSGAGTVICSALILLTGARGCGTPLERWQWYSPVDRPQLAQLVRQV